MKALESYQVSCALLSLPQQKTTPSSSPKPKASVKTHQFSKPKGKGKSKGSNKGPRVPYQIIQAGRVGKTLDGSNICLKYNIEVAMMLQMVQLANVECIAVPNVSAATV